jgi:hypothetical protein
LEANQLAHAQAAGVEQLQHGAVAHANGGVHIGRVQQGLDLRLAQRLGHPQRLLGRLQLERGVGAEQVLAQGPAEKALKYRQAPVGRARFGGVVAGCKKLLQLRLVAGDQRLTV